MIILAIAAPSAAGNPQWHCERLSTQSEMNRCSALRAQAADAAMTREWDRAALAMKRLDRDSEASHTGNRSYFGALLSSQRAWLKFREAECVIEGYENRGGTLQPMTETDCYTQLTNDRTRQLRDFLSSIGE